MYCPVHVKTYFDNANVTYLFHKEQRRAIGLSCIALNDTLSVSTLFNKYSDHAFIFICTNAAEYFIVHWLYNQYTH